LALIFLMRFVLAWATTVLAVSVAQAVTWHDGQQAYDFHDYTSARHIWQTLANAGDAEAEYRLGLLYDLGNGVAEDQAAAYYWYRLAAEAKLPAAEFNVAVMDDSGRGVSRDSSAAALWYARAALHEHARAQYNLGQLYATGDGVPRNLDQAAIWFKAAAANGVRAAAESLTKIKEPPQPMDTSRRLAAPIPTAPSDHSEVDATSDTVELVWNAPRQPVPVTFFLEMIGVDQAELREVFSGYTDLSAAVVAVSGGSAIYAWRVYAVSRTHYSASKWQLFSVHRLLRTLTAK
jgi:Sel1 repeat